MTNDQQTYKNSFTLFFAGLASHGSGSNPSLSGQVSDFRDEASSQNVQDHYEQNRQHQQQLLSSSSPNAQFQSHMVRILVKWWQTLTVFV